MCKGVNKHYLPYYYITYTFLQFIILFLYNFTYSTINYTFYNQIIKYFTWITNFHPPPAGYARPAGAGSPHIEGLVSPDQDDY